MNNTAKRITRNVASIIRELIIEAIEDPSRSKEILRGGGNNGGLITKHLMNKPIENIRISKNAIQQCRKHNVFLHDFFLLRDSKQLQNKYGKFFSSNAKTLQDRIASGQRLHLDHNAPNSVMIKDIYRLARTIYEKYGNFDKLTVEKIIQILNSQSLDFITVEEDDQITKKGFKSSGTKRERDALCSEKIDITDVWLTPQHIIDQFFETSGLNKKECLDPCACDGRWLNGEGASGDILPMHSSVSEKNFLEVTELRENIKHIIGNIPFSLTTEFVEKAFALRGEAFFLVNGDTIMNKYNGHIKHIWIINGIEGNQKDFRSRCEFDTIVLKKSALWCCIVHLTKEKQPEFIIEHNISNEQKRDGFHVALGRNTYSKSETLVIENSRITRLHTKGTIEYKK